MGFNSGFKGLIYVKSKLQRFIFFLLFCGEKTERGISTHRNFKLHYYKFNTKNTKAFFRGFNYLQIFGFSVGSWKLALAKKREMTVYGKNSSRLQNDASCRTVCSSYIIYTM